MMKGAATIFTVRDLMASIAYYRDKMDFMVTFEYGEPPYYACLYHDEVSLHLRSASKNAEWVAGNGAIAVFVDDVDALHADLVESGANVIKVPRDYAYGMRDFDVADPDGNQLTFGMETRARIA
jgi:catechol 2,3-dioxygenase-like lactoylglutathione lyase family enzyme